MEIKPLWSPAVWHVIKILTSSDKSTLQQTCRGANTQRIILETRGRVTGSVRRSQVHRLAAAAVCPSLTQSRLHDSAWEATALDSSVWVWADAKGDLKVPEISRRFQRTDMEVKLARKTDHRNQHESFQWKHQRIPLDLHKKKWNKNHLFVFFDKLPRLMALMQRKMQMYQIINHQLSSDPNKRTEWRLQMLWLPRR